MSSLATQAGAYRTLLRDNPQYPQELFVFLDTTEVFLEAQLYTHFCPY